MKALTSSKMTVPIDQPNWCRIELSRYAIHMKESTFIWLKIHQTSQHFAQQAAKMKFLDSFKKWTEDEIQKQVIRQLLKWYKLKKKIK